MTRDRLENLFIVSRNPKKNLKKVQIHFARSMFIQDFIRQTITEVLTLSVASSYIFDRVQFGRRLNAIFKISRLKYTITFPPPEHKSSK